MKAIVFAATFMAVLCACQLEKDGADGLKTGNDVTCTSERKLMENAVEAFYTLEGRQPSTEADLVPTYLRVQSNLMDLDILGNVVAAPGTSC